MVSFPRDVSLTLNMTIEVVILSETKNPCGSTFDFTPHAFEPPRSFPRDLSLRSSRQVSVTPNT